MSNVMNREFGNLIPEKPEYPLLRIRALADGFPSGSIYIRPIENGLQRMLIPAEGNDAWCNAATMVELTLKGFRFIDDRTLYCEAYLTVDQYVAGEPTPVTLLITDHFCNPCGMVNFSKRIQVQQFGQSGGPIHSFSLVFDHVSQ